MNEIALKLRNKVMEQFRPLVEDLAREGRDQDEIIKSFQSLMRRRVSDYYHRNMDSMREILHSIAGKSEADSRVESIFYDLLKKNNISFDFQYQIGKYRADFRLGENIILEIDGPYHNQERDDIRDRYIEKLGYEIVRIPVWLLVSEKNFLIGLLKEKVKALKGKEI